ncbi:Adenomatous polyposis coli tumor suppressor protein [Tyrophagus putrescentiae]|nr:Adenomatous polyposis coli tumor suppressor protein [Tyrophagus putrescentiae]
MQDLCEATEDNPFIHGMSKQFVKALQQLFDVMDTTSTGTIRYVDLATQWEEDQSDPLFPRGLVTCLAKVTLPSGLLTFDRFCAGIKLCLLKNQVELKQAVDIAGGEVVVLGGPESYHHNHHQHHNALSRPPSEPQIFAPPPPPLPTSLPPLPLPPPPPPPPPQSSHLGGPHSPSTPTTTSEINNNTSLYNNNHAHNNGNCFGGGGSSSSTSSSFNASLTTTTTAAAANSANLSDDLKSAKKLPLPSYDQVMAAKSKSMSKLTLDGPAFPPLNGHHHHLLTNDELAKFAVVNNTNNSGGNCTTKSSTSLYVKPPQPLPPPSQEHHRVPNNNNNNNLSLYENFALLSNESTRYPSDGFSQRAKSMSNLENIQQQLQPNSIYGIDQHTTNSQNQKSISSTSLARNLSHQQPAQSLQQQQPKTVSRNCIIKTLQSWRDNILHKGGEANTSSGGGNGETLNGTTTTTSSTSSTSMHSSSGSKAAVVSAGAVVDKQGVERLSTGGQTVGAAALPPPNSPAEQVLVAQQNSLKRSGAPKRREPRRHTVGANGIDLYTIKRFQQLEQEKDILMRGLNEIDKTKEWYKRQIACIQDKINFAGQAAGGGGAFSATGDCNAIDALQERLNFQATRIANLNAHLSHWHLPLHSLNLAIRPFNGVNQTQQQQQLQQQMRSMQSQSQADPNQPKTLVVNPNLVNKLKEQNRLLTDEVSRKSDRITKLEREKSSLIRELFQARTYSSYYNGDFDDTFM